MKRKKLELTITVLMYLSAAALSGSIAILILKRFHKLVPVFFQNNFLMTAYAPLLAAVLLALTLTLSDGKYAFQRMRFSRCLGRSVTGNIVIGGIWAIFLLISKNSITESRYYFVGTLCLNVVFLTLLLFLVQRITINRFYKTNTASICAVLTTRGRAPYLTDSIKQDWYRRIVGLALVEEETAAVGMGTGDNECEREEIDHIPIVSSAAGFVDWVRENALDEVVVAVDYPEDSRVLNAIWQINQMGIPVSVNLASAERLHVQFQENAQEGYTPRVEQQFSFLGGTPLLTVGPRQEKLRFVLLKRAMDVCGGLVGVIICGILFILVAPAILIESPGPVFFGQERIGKNGRKFKMYKFRSMYKDAEARKKELMNQNEMSGLMFKIKDDPRITRVGKFIRKTSIDEFPQFYNVLKGDMSLVGTRPPTEGEFHQYSNYHKRRLSMKPGITGMWQVSGRSDIKDFEEVVRLDCEYIDNWSIWLDIRLLVKTILIVFKHEGAR